jgi:hypothetical protein
MTKFKHNKKRNTAFIYESLVIELTKAVLSADGRTQKKVKSMIKEYFKKDSFLLKDLRIYQAIVETKNVKQETAEKILYEAKKQKEKINSKQLFNEQNRIIDKINKTLHKNFFSNFIPNYKGLASISQIFNLSSPIKSRVLLESEIIKEMITEQPSDEMLPVDSFTYKIFTEKFNKEYSETLLEEQKELLKKYISSFKDNGLELKIYLDEEIGRLKKEVTSCFDTHTIKEDKPLTEKLNKVSTILNNFVSQKPDDEMLKAVISIQSVVKEIKENVN